MRASLIQIDVKPDEPVESRRSRAADLVREQSGADLVVLPELWTVGAFAFEEFAAHAEPLDGPTSAAMSDAARDAGVWLHAGSVVERGEGGALYNTALLFAPSGALHRTYRKIHRFGFDRGEVKVMTAGKEIVTARLESPDVTLGLATCYDLRFPEQFRLLTDAGAEIIVLPAGWPARRRAHWSLLVRARAVETQTYVLACGTAGTHAGVEQAGYSVVLDPWGEVVAEAGAGEQVLTADFDPARVAETREQFPVLRDRVLGLPTPPPRA
ncbi:carbon-nitrogen family hydrolase [Streptantibioticus silvisoli]|uniref:Carbon-nitrogen family hydrolase n=1 Tax=Streptantibioticus silvisoli TaxID=2705255 RepID=A0ABT6W0S6_9ACTN|nr:carbon-nitrogen family hydrolase [Streptantibioticus silvisoli]MDI5964269.1 carbon-nitrogen family hydrolase [Streptantibioticus silvisoli]